MAPLGLGVLGNVEKGVVENWSEIRKVAERRSGTVVTP